MKNSRIYLHEFIDIIGHHRADYFEHMTAGWRTAAKAPVKNVDLWQRLDAVVSTGGHQIDWRWVRGHAGDPGNERADALANKGVEMALANGRTGQQG